MEKIIAAVSDIQAMSAKNARDTVSFIDAADADVLWVVAQNDTRVAIRKAAAARLAYLGLPAEKPAPTTKRARKAAPVVVPEPVVEPVVEDDANAERFTAEEIAAVYALYGKMHKCTKCGTVQPTELRRMSKPVENADGTRTGGICRPQSQGKGCRSGGSCVPKAAVVETAAPVTPAAPASKGKSKGKPADVAPVVSKPTPRDEVVAWLRANDWRFKAAAKQFGVDYETVAQWGRLARAADAAASKAASKAATEGTVTPKVAEHAARKPASKASEPAPVAAAPVVDAPEYELVPDADGTVLIRKGGRALARVADMKIAAMFLAAVSK